MYNKTINMPRIQDIQFLFLFFYYIFLIKKEIDM